MRIIHHPILGDMPDRKKVIIKVDGAEVEAYEGEPIAAALMAAGIKVFRRTRKRTSRDAYSALWADAPTA